MKVQSDYLAYCKENTTPTDINVAIEGIVTPAKTQLSAIRAMDDVVKIVLSGGNVEADWNTVRESYKGFGIEQAIKEVNEAAAKQ